MRIVDLRWTTCSAAWRNWVFVEVETDSGLVGVGEATIEGREQTIAGHLEDLRRVVVGSDPLAINHMRRRLTRDPHWVGGYVASTGLAGVELALWDIAGKHYGVPVWQLLGGRLRDRVRVYANGWHFGADSVEDWVERAGAVVELGFDALKFDPFGKAGHSPDRSEIDEAIEIVAAIRRSIGASVDLLIEGHGRFSVHAAARIAARLEKLDCLFFEEPLAPGNPDALAVLASKTSVPIAAGERCHSRLEARRYLETGAVQVLQPDVLHVGGIAEALAIAAVAEQWFIPVAPHNPNGGVATAATLAVDAVCPNFLIQEILAPWDAPWRHEVVRGCPRVRDGHLIIPDAPGLGVELDHEQLNKHPFAPVDPELWSSESILLSVDLRRAASPSP